MVGGTVAVDDPFSASGSLVTRHWKKLAQKKTKTFLCIGLGFVDRDDRDDTDKTIF